MKFVIYHNPRCSKSRQALEILRNNNITPTVIEYLSTPPDEQELRHIVTLLGKRPRDIVRIKEEEFRATSVNLDNDDEVLAYLAENPRMIERPIIIAGPRAVIGRPPEAVLELIASVQ